MTTNDTVRDALATMLRTERAAFTEGPNDERAEYVAAWSTLAWELGADLNVRDYLPDFTFGFGPHVTVSMHRHFVTRELEQPTVNWSALGASSPARTAAFVAALARATAAALQLEAARLALVEVTA